jgi:hypothetical protein
MTARTAAGSDVVRWSLLSVALLTSVGGLFAEGGRAGVAVAVVGVAVAVATAGFYGVAVQHLGAVALVDAASAVGITLLETATLFLLVADAPPGQRLEVGTVSVPAIVLFAVGTVSLAQDRGFVTASVLLAVVVTVGGYLLHRYASVRFGGATRELDQ